LTVQQIISDTELKVEIVDESIQLPSEQSNFVIFKRVDQGEVYSAVLNRLGENGCIGIFPEGGSHDRSDLLPLKVGVALIAYSALERDGINIPIVPVGLNYFNAHRFRGRAIVEFGAPLFIDPNTLDSFKQGGKVKREVCNDLLERIQDSMRSVIVTAPDYETLQFIHTCRRLFQQAEMSASEKQDLARRFSEGYRRLLAQSKGNPPKEWVDMYDGIMKYQKELEDLGIRDYQVPELKHEKYDLEGDTVLRTMRIPFRILVLLFVMGLALVPGVLLNYPVGLIARLHAERRRKTALAESTVKIRGQDVILSEKVVICIALVPTLWCIYAILLYIFSDMDGPTLALSIFSMPLSSYMGIMMTQAGMIQLKDLRPYIVRIFPSSRRRLLALPSLRQELQQALRVFVKEISPMLGEVYYEKDLDWNSIHQKWRKSSANLAQLCTEEVSSTPPEVKKDM
jgi:glycerol-3-phosphate O-acyltransferase/dihydroxyacetone phosphate acyltransferase